MLLSFILVCLQLIVERRVLKSTRRGKNFSYDDSARPGNEIFFIFNQGWRQDERSGFRMHQAGAEHRFESSFRF
ncbi:MAG: hypothetical protein DMG15_16660 [Acidobacteria bacterium]|nr:MAG: hypothetical protein DMG16_26170 [Acidobacteriota bacterium]PYS11772.1 MAG: hypothetical protein DMG15_16660 [Acidobacteriota bacterium]